MHKTKNIKTKGKHQNQQASKDILKNIKIDMEKVLNFISSLFGTRFHINFITEKKIFIKVIWWTTIFFRYKEDFENKYYGLVRTENK